MADVKVGDRVRLTNNNGDVAEVTVISVYQFHPAGIRTETNQFYWNDGWEVEILTPAVPTEPGWYESEEYPLSKSSVYKPYQLTRNGQWYLGNTYIGTGAMRNQGRLHRLVREGSAQ